MTSNSIAFLGAGNMAEAILKAALSGGLFKPQEVTAFDISQERRTYLQTTYGIQIADSNLSAAKNADIVVLAVKPQQIDEVMAFAGPAISPTSLLISICAGISTAHLETLTSAHVIRVMPNLPAAVQLGVSVICAGTRAGAVEMTAAEMLFGAIGKVVRLPEEHLNAVTALSGSGPAYVFALMEDMLRAARQMGISETDAHALVLHTVRGAAELAIQSGETPEVLRQRVTSPGGTTQAALVTMEAGGWSRALVAGILAARDRAAELAN